MSSAGELLDALTDAGRGELIGNGLVLRANVRAIRLISVTGTPPWRRDRPDAGESRRRFAPAIQPAIVVIGLWSCSICSTFPTTSPFCHHRNSRAESHDLG
jgi:hypothetical protein